MKFCKELINPKYQIFALNYRNNGKLVHYFLENPESIQKEIKSMTFRPGEEPMMCGYDYSIQFYEKNKLKKYALVCFDCKAMSFEKETAGIDVSEFQNLFHSFFIPVKENIIIFNTREDGISYWEKKKKESQIIDFENLLPKWIFFEGKFETVISLPLEASSDIFKIYTKAKQILEKNISTYVNKSFFEIAIFYSATQENVINITFEVCSSRKTYETLQIKKSEWNQFNDFTLKTYSK